MKLYRVTRFDSQEGVCYEWFASKAKANARLKELRMEYPEDEQAAVYPVAVPTNRKQAEALADWLSENFSRDNG